MLKPISAVPGILSPAIPGGLGAALLGILYQLEQSQWWTPERMLERQAEQLSSVLGHAYATIPFCRGRLRSAGYEPGVKVTPELMTAIPPLPRKELQEAERAIISTALPQEHGETSPIFTSGSTGRPVRLLGTSVTATFWLAFTLRDHLWHRRDLGGKLAALRDSKEEQARPPNGMRQACWGPATASTFANGPAVKLTSSSLIGEQVEWLLREQPDYLLTHPSNLVGLVRRFQSIGRRLDKLKDVTTVGERVDDGMRTACREGLGVPIKDMYTAQEVGYMALQCPDHEHYHVQSENVYLEIVRDDGSACAEGENGRVLVTSLHNFATPLIRYDIGDFARVGRPCACGRGLPVIEGLLGRSRNMLTLPSGEQRWPHFGSVHFDEVVKIKQFQLVQKSLERIEMRVSAPVQPNPRQEAALRSILRRYLGYPFEISFVYMDEVPRGAGGKFEDFLSELPIAPAAPSPLAR